MPINKQVKEFGTYDLNKKYFVLICGNQVVHPPAIYLIDPFAHEGKSAVAFLEEKLSSTTDDLTIRDIVMVFREMQRQEAYSVNSDAQLMEKMRENISRIKDKTWRDFVEDKYKEILSLPST